MPTGPEYSESELRRTVARDILPSDRSAVVDQQGDARLVALHIREPETRSHIQLAPLLAEQRRAVAEDEGVHLQDQPVDQAGAEKRPGQHAAATEIDVAALARLE